MNDGLESLFPERSGLFLNSPGIIHRVPAGKEKEMKNTDLTGCRIIDTDKTALTMTTDDGKDIRCSIVRIFDLRGQKYIVLIPEDGSTEGSGYLLRFDISPDGMPVLENIPTDEEYGLASEVFTALNETLELTE